MRTWFVMLVLAMAAVAPGSAYAQTSTPASGGTLTTGSAGGTLNGGEIVYQLPLPGGSLTAQVLMQYDPPDNSGAVGFSLSGSQGEIPGIVRCVGQYSDNTRAVVITPLGAAAPVTVLAPGTPFCASLQTTMAAAVMQVMPETYTLKVYNRKPGVPIHYSLTVTGIPLACQPATPPGGPTPAQAALLGSPVTSQIGGGPRGQFTYYHFPYAGDSSTVQLVMFYNPVTPDTRQGAFGFNVYLGSTLIAQGQPSISMEGQLVAGFGSATAGDYYVQVFNYVQPPLLVNYTLSQNGLPCPASASAGRPAPAPQASAASAADGKTSDTALPFANSDNRTLEGATNGAFVWYRIDYDGHSNPFLNMTYTPVNFGQLNGLGFNLYGPGSTSAQATVTTPGSLSLVMPSYPDRAPFYVQVFNYIPGSTVSFSLQRS